MTDEDTENTIDTEAVKQQPVPVTTAIQKKRCRGGGVRPAEEEAIMAFMSTHLSWTDARIAREFGRGPQVISRIRKKLTGTALYRAGRAVAGDILVDFDSVRRILKIEIDRTQREIDALDGFIKGMGGLNGMNPPQVAAITSCKTSLISLRSSLCEKLVGTDLGVAAHGIRMWHEREALTASGATSDRQRPATELPVGDAESIRRIKEWEKSARTWDRTLSSASASNAAGA